MKSDARYHVVFCTYVVPELLKAGKYVSCVPKVCWNFADAVYSRAEILDFTCVKSDLFSPDGYVETAKDLYNARGEADECPSYMVIYETIHSACKEQR